MENIKRNQLPWIPINCSRSVSGISLGFYYNSYYMRCDWLNTSFDWSLLKNADLVSSSLLRCLHASKAPNLGREQN